MGTLQWSQQLVTVAELQGSNMSIQAKSINQWLEEEMLLKEQCKQQCTVQQICSRILGRCMKQISKWPFFIFRTTFLLPFAHITFTFRLSAEGNLGYVSTLSLLSEWTRTDVLIRHMFAWSAVLLPVGSDVCALHGPVHWQRSQIRVRSHKSMFFSHYKATIKCLVDSWSLNKQYKGHITFLRTD